MTWFPGSRLLAALCLAAVVLLTACPPPIVPHPPPVYPISQCKDVFPGGPYTRPTPTNHPIYLLPAYGDVRIILWLDHNCGWYYQGPIDYRYPNTPFCSFHPELGDRYYSEDDRFIAPIPPPCA